MRLVKTDFSPVPRSQRPRTTNPRSLFNRSPANGEDDLRHIPYNRLSRWQRILQLQQHFWARWYKEYLNQLQTRPKGQQIQQRNITKDTMVVLVEDHLPPLRWKLGRVVETHPGSDGIVRTVSVKTVTGVFKRVRNSYREWYIILFAIVPSMSVDKLTNMYILQFKLFCSLLLHYFFYVILY